MPLYEYQCEKCGEQFEVMQKFADDPLTTHEKCGGPVQRLLSAPALQFKGSGWYITDYAKSASSGAPTSSNDGAKSDGGAKKDSGSSTSSDTSSKPASSPSSTPKAD